MSLDDVATRVLDNALGLRPEDRAAIDAADADAKILREYREACVSQGLPENCPVEMFVRHHRGNAGLTAAMNMHTKGVHDERVRVLRVIDRQASSYQSLTAIRNAVDIGRGEAHIGFPVPDDNTSEAG